MKQNIWKRAGALLLALTLALSLVFSLAAATESDGISVELSSSTLTLKEVDDTDTLTATITVTATGTGDGSDDGTGGDTGGDTDDGTNTLDDDDENTGGGTNDGTNDGTDDDASGTTEQTVSVAWSSNDTDVATVSGGNTDLVTLDENGQATVTATVTAVSEGKATITVTVNGTVTDTCEVTVGETQAPEVTPTPTPTPEPTPTPGPTPTPEPTPTPAVPVTGVSLNKSTSILSGVGASELLNATAAPATATNKNVTWSSSNEKIATVGSDGTVTGVAPGEATITATTEDGGYTATCVVTVSGIVLNESELELRLGKTFQLSPTLYGNAQGIVSRQWSSSDATKVEVSSSGRLNGRAVGTANITLKMGSYSTVCKVTVVEDTATILTGNVALGGTFSFSSIRATMNSLSVTETGEALSYVSNLSVATSSGILYYKWTSSDDTGAGVGISERYYYSPSLASQRAFADVTFVPKSDFTGTAEISYTAYSLTGEAFTGSIRLTVGAGSGNSGTGEGTGSVNYAAAPGVRVAFTAAAFNTASLAAINETLDYVRFSLPDSSVGTLYYNYTSSSGGSAVLASNRYYRNGTPGISSISFVPASNEVETVTIDFVGYGTGGNRFEGTVVITYKGSTVDGQISYSTRSGGAAQFDTADFNELCADVTGKSLDYIRFDALPSVLAGTLYYNYTSPSSQGIKVTTNTRCYRSGSPSLSRVAFVAVNGYTGAVSIDFTGYNSDGTEFKGVLVIEVTENDLVVRYSARTGTTVAFDAASFNEVCQDATGSTLNYIRFTTLPTANQGTLYYKYGETGASKVTSTTNYYRVNSTRLIENITFVPTDNYTGTVKLYYMGMAANGESFNGIVEIQVYLPTANTIRYAGTSLPVSFAASNFSLACRTVLEGSLDYVQFTTLPSETAGRLYYGYNGYNTGTRVTSSTKYYLNGTPSLNLLTFVPKADYTGTVNIQYTAVDTEGNRASGTVSVVVSTPASHFTDMASYSWAAGAVEYLYDAKVITGITDTTYGPGQSILRRDFVLMLCRTFGFNSGKQTSFPDVNPDSYYAWAVASAKDLGIVQGSDGLFLPNTAITRQDAMVMLQRAMRAAGMTVSDGSYADLVTFSDRAQVADYAVGPLAAMVRMGMVQGSDGMLMPYSSINRAETAVLLHRMMTL